MPAGYEEQLVREVLAGDIDRFEAIVRSYQNRLAGLAYRMGIRYDEVEDIVVEVMTKTFRNLHLYRPEYAFSTWIYRIAINHIRDHHRRRRREPGREEMPEQVASSDPGPLEEVDDSQQARQLRAAIDRLPERYRIPVILMHLEEKSLEEIAAILAVPVGTVKSRLARGRGRLRKILVRDFPHFGGRSGEPDTG